MFVVLLKKEENVINAMSTTSTANTRSEVFLGLISLVP